MSTSDSTSCNNKEIDGTSKSSVSEVNDMLQNMTTDKEDKDIVSVCANCGKEGSDVRNICNKCKQVTYCNASCKKKHRHKHKKDCEEHVRLAAEHAAELHDIELFKQPPPEEECPICFIRLPLHVTGWKYQSCCGKVICSGCFNSPIYDNQGNTVDNQMCAFCRTPTPKSLEEAKERHAVRVEGADAIAIYNQGVCCRDGTLGFPQDHTKALELFHRAGELGCANAYNSIGYAYEYGEGVGVDMKQVKYYYELAAMKGDVTARYNLGCLEKKAGKEMALRHLMGGNAVAWHNLDYEACEGNIKRAMKGNMDRAVKHHMIAVGCGYSKSLEKIKDMFTDGFATKEDYTRALKLYQTYLAEIKSPQRDEAAAAKEYYRYY